MKRFAIVPVLAVLGVIFIAGRPVQQGLADADEAAIKASVEAWNQAALALDWGAIAELCTEDIVLMAPNSPAIEGRAALQEGFESWGFTEYFTHDSVVTVVEGRVDLASVKGIYS